jgi:hypothetical protein
MTDCPTCHGTGNGEYLGRIEYIGGNYADRYRPCKDCDGTGKTEIPMKELPKARLLTIKRATERLRFAYFRCANFGRVHLWWVVVQFRLPWLPHSARALYGDRTHD